MGCEPNGAYGLVFCKDDGSERSGCNDDTSPLGSCGASLGTRRVAPSISQRRHTRCGLAERYIRLVSLEPRCVQPAQHRTPRHWNHRAPNPTEGTPNCIRRTTSRPRRNDNPASGRPRRPRSTRRHHQSKPIGPGSSQRERHSARPSLGSTRPSRGEQLGAVARRISGRPRPRKERSRRASERWRPTL